MILEKEKNLALLTHLSGFGSYLFPFGSVLIPFVIRETKKKESEFMDQLTKDVVNFNLSYLLYNFAIMLFVIPIFIGDVLGNIFTNDSYNFEYNNGYDEFLGLISCGSAISIIMIVKFVLIIKAAIKTHNGEEYNYPLTIKFLK